MAELVQFVDSIASSPTVLLDVSAAPWRTTAVSSIAPAPLRIAQAGTLMSDGQIIQGSAYDNRVVNLALQLDSSSRTTAATQMQLLNRILDGPTSILKWQTDASMSPVFFRCFRSPDYQPDTDYGINLFRFALALRAEPFAYGLPVSSSATVNSDPAAGSNPKYFDITSVQGDVSTPLIVSAPKAGVDNYQSLFAVRRRGTPSNMPYLKQAESCTLGTDTALGTNSTTWSGAGQNNTVTSFSTVTSLAKRLSFTWPPSATPDARGIYRVWARCASSTTPNTFTVQLRYGGRAIQNTSFSSANVFNTRGFIDLGLIQIPVGADPNQDGPSGTSLSVAATSIPIEVWASRDSGSGTLIFDYLLLMPADDRLGIVNWGTSANPTSYVFDGAKGMVYGVDASNRVIDIGSSYYVGEGPQVSPGVTNRIFFIEDVTLHTAAFSPTEALPASSVAISYTYYPRYLMDRPVST